MTNTFVMHFFLDGLCYKYRKDQPAVFGPDRRDVQYNEESQTKNLLDSWRVGSSKTGFSLWVPSRAMGPDLIRGSLIPLVI